jgi:YidC/Oxa1 family membrane protein insertase
VSGILQSLGQLLSPIGTLFHVVFYLPIYNVLILFYLGVHAIMPVGFPAFAVAIFLLTVLVRLCLFPLTRKQLQSSRAMQALTPQLNELRQRYKNNPQEMMAAQQALYREHGVSMYGGCLPLLIQMPFLYGLYFSLYTALLPPKYPNGHFKPAIDWLHQINHDIYPFLPHLTVHTLPSTLFLWTNLAFKDPLFILPILAGLLTFIQLRMAQPVKAPTPPGQRSDPNTQAMSSMQFVMPFITFFMALNFPSGLAFYWAISTGFSAVQQYFLTGFGSLFSGIPGLEHLVPAPQTAPALSAGGRPAAASGLVDAGAGPRRSSGMNRFAAMLRDLAAPQQPNDAEKDGVGASPPSQNGKSANKASGKPETVYLNSGGQQTSANGRPSESPEGASGLASRRQRPARVGPTLVKPPSAPPGEASGPSDASDQSADGTSAGTSSPAPSVSPPSPREQLREQLRNGARSPGAGGSSSRSTSSGVRHPSSGSSARRRPGGKSKGGR